VYDLTSGTPTVPVVILNNPDAAAHDNFGRRVAISGSRVVVAATGDDTGATDAGSTYVYDLNSSTPTVPAMTLNNPNPVASEFFGHAVAIDGPRIVVSAYQNDTGASNAGCAYVYDLGSGTPGVPMATLNNPTPEASDQFGLSVSISGTLVLVGAYMDDTGAINAGSAYLYDVGNSTPTVPVRTLENPSPAAGDLFGFSVAIDGGTAAIGSPYDDTTSPDEGSIYIYGPHPLDQDSDGLLDTWEELHWPGATALHGPLDDDDHDGLVNLLELAFGLNPNVPDAGALTPLTQEGGYLTMTLTKRPGAAYEVQSAGTLTPGQPDSFSATTTTVLLDDPTTLKVRDNTLTSTAPARFMRVQVTGAP
jgi:hypothetical protein